MAMEQSFAMIGTGVMGRGMALNLSRGGATVYLYARRLEAVKELQAEGMEASTDPLEAVSKANTVIVCLTTDEVVRSVLFDSGMFSSLKDRAAAGEPICIIDTGTTSPGLTMEMAGLCQDAGIGFLDAPMTGSRNGAESGQILFMVGGPDRLIDAQSFFFETCGKQLIRCGSVGSGQNVKIVLNMTQASMLQSLMEGWIFSRKLGVTSDVFQQVIRESAAKCGISEFKMGCVYREDFDVHFALKHMNKDVNHAIHLAMEHNASLPLAFALKSVYDAGINQGQGEEDFCSLSKVNERLNGLR